MSAGTASRTTLAPIRSRQTFEDLRRSRVRGRSGPITVVFVPQPSWSRGEVAYSINRKLGNAVTRNRLRRRLRAVIWGQAPSLPAGAYLLRPGPEAPRLGFDELTVAVGRALEQAIERAGPAGRMAGRTRAAGASR